jgi:uncharacterized membrane protein YraQ (UPF0718 family)
MIDFFAFLVPGIITLMASILCLYGFQDVLSGLLDMKKDQFDPQNSPTSKILSGIWKIIAFSSVAIIHADLKLDIHPLYLFSKQVTDQLGDIGKYIWFGHALVVFIQMIIISSIAFSRFLILSKFLITIALVCAIYFINYRYSILIS